MTSFVHTFKPGATPDAPALLLLHGTGGDENDLLPLGQAILPEAALLSPRGQVLEQGMPRFFRRLDEGVFDEDDVRRRANELADFIAESQLKYHLPPLIALGYSNGANIAAATMLLRPESMAGGMLLRAMDPLRNAPKVELTGKPVLIISGEQDPIIPAENAARLAAKLRASGAKVEQKLIPIGHGLSNLDVSIARQWLKQALLSI